MPLSPETLVVDLDGTLVRTDLFLESAMRFLKAGPMQIPRLLSWLSQGRASAKARVAAAIAIDPAQLPYEEAVLQALRARKHEGARLILATAAPQPYAQAVAAHLGCFDDVIASTEATNTKAASKLAALRELIGDAPFEYAGNDHADQPLWQAASSCMFVNSPPQYVAQARAQGKAVVEVHSKKPLRASWLRQLRVHQWIKNLLVLLPLLASHSYFEPAALLTAALACGCFCLSSSAVYIINDLFDLAEDRAHPSKQHRPLAAGDLSIREGIVGAGVLLFSVLVVSLLTMPWLFSACLFGYLLTNYAYSIYLKRIWAVDALVLAGLYTSRILAGAAALALAPSFWLLSFSLFVFLGLAYLKRYIELGRVQDDTQGRGYQLGDAETLFSLGVSNMTVAVLVLALYIQDSSTLLLYRQPEMLWLLCVIAVYWSNRIWFKARRALIDDDPVIWALQDPVSRILAVAAIVIIVAARTLSL